MKFIYEDIQFLLLLLIYGGRTESMDKYAQVCTDALYVLCSLAVQVPSTLSLCESLH